MSTPFPITTESGTILTTEYGASLLIESSPYGITTNLATAGPYQALITSEHNQKPNFMNLVGVLTASLGDITALVQSVPSLFNLATAQGNQLDIIGQWIGQSRVILGVLVAGYFGFSELGTGAPDGLQLPFGELSDASIGGLFYGLGESATATTTLNDAQYRQILTARIVRNQANGTLAALEQGLFDIFGIPCKVIDNGTLNLSIVVPAPVSPVDQALVTNFDILPRPAGVAIGSIIFTP